MSGRGRFGLCGLGLAAIAIAFGFARSFGQDPRESAATPPPADSSPSSDEDASSVARAPAGDPSRSVQIPAVQEGVAAPEIEAATIAEIGGPSGGLTEEHRRALLHWKDQFHDTADRRQKDFEAFHYATQSVHILLRSDGRADPGTPEEQARGLVATPHHENEWIFLSDRARFRFDRGEFPAYDQVRDRMRDARSLEEQGLEPAEFPEALVLALDELAKRALDRFDRR